MNFRCNLLCGDAKMLAHRNDVRTLVASDQLLEQKGDHELMRRFEEAPITFLPTFKYDKRSDVYDTSKK